LLIFYANAFSITTSENVFLVFDCIVNGEKKSVCVVVSPSGARTLVEALSKHLVELEKDNGAIKPWELPKETPNGNNQNYVR
jgi:hypothetical protein